MDIFKVLSYETNTLLLPNLGQCILLKYTKPHRRARLQNHSSLGGIFSVQRKVFQS